MTGMFLRAASVAILALGLGGCLDLSSRTVVNPDGSMTVSSDVGIDKAVATQLGKMTGAGKPQSDGSGDFGQMCQKGFDSAFKEMQSTLGGRGKSDEARPTAPRTSGTVSERDGFVVCTFTETLKEPLKQYAEIMQKSGLGAGFGSLELLPGGNGYRFSSSFRMADVMQGQTLSDEERQGVALVAGMIPREMTTSVTIGGLKVENTNGSVSADGKSVTWKIPLHTIFDMRPEAEPLKMTADVYFK